LTELGKKMEAVQKGFEDQAKAIQDEEQNKLRLYKVGSPEYQQTEEHIVSEKANIQGQIGLKRKEFVQQQAALYAAAYEEVHADVNNFCARNGFTLVLNFNSDPMHVENPDDVVRCISKPVVAYDRNMDITPYIMPRYAPPASAGPVGVNVPPYGAGQQH
jgi:hypothetical protein